MTIHLSRAEARRFLALYHFAPTDIPGVLDRLGTVQYDPLNPVGRNPDLVFQARVPGYCVDDWQQAAYTDRVFYDSWDKQACLVPISDWPHRALIREKYQPDLDSEFLRNEADATQAVLSAIDDRGPLSSLEFEDRTRSGGLYSWNSSTRTNRILRSLWAAGQLVTHHRRNGRHYYDRPERVIPPHHFSASPLLDEEAYYRWIILRRFTAVGLLRKTAEAAIWSVCGASNQRERALQQLLESGQLTPIIVGDSADSNNKKSMLYYMPSKALNLLNFSSPILGVPKGSSSSSGLEKGEINLPEYSSERVIVGTGVVKMGGGAPCGRPSDLIHHPLPTNVDEVPIMRFLAPLDSMLWDRKGIQHIFDFVYSWEVYKPAATRIWGYYVLPVFYGDRFVARLDSRLEKGVWTLARWWWEPDIVPDADMLDALRLAGENFFHYLRATDVHIHEDVDANVRLALSQGK